MSGATQRVGMVAGEASGDLLGAHLIGALLARRPGLRFTGIGGPRMIAEGFENRFPMEKLAVRGYAEVWRHYREIMGIRRKLGGQLLRERPRLFVGIDAPDFNLGLETRLKNAGIPCVHYVSPSVWAWRGWRIRRIARAATHMLALFPFEPPLYEKAGLSVTFVGHPLADLIPMQSDRAAARVLLRLPAGRPVVALLPGSRKSEMAFMGDLFVRAAVALREHVKDVHFVCPTASRETRDMLESAVRNRVDSEFPLTLLFGHSHDALAAADVALVASGTATLEAALHKTPMTIAYCMSPLTWTLMRRMLYLPYIGLPNILAGENLVPEYLQEAATPEALAGSLAGLLQSEAARRRQIEKFSQIHLLLRQNAAEKAAAAVLAVMDGRNP